MPMKEKEDHILSTKDKSAKKKEKMEYSTAFNKENNLESYLKAVQLSLGSVFPVTMKAAVELGVFEIIASEGTGARLSAAQIVDKLPHCNNTEAAASLERILVLLVSHGVLSCSLADNGTRLFCLTPVAMYFVPNQDGVSLAPYLSFNQDFGHMTIWSHLKEAVLEGGSPFKKAHGMNLFDYFKSDQRMNLLFNNGLFNHSCIVIKELVETYKGFEKVKQLVDVGGGLGVTLNMIVSKYPHIKGINFDLAHVIQTAPKYSGVEHIAGDMFQSVPNGDAIFMKWILHDWSDEYCIKLLKNCHEALPDDGKVIVMDSVVPAELETNFATQNIADLDIYMLAFVPGGKERTREEFVRLATAAKFKRVDFHSSVCNIWVMELFK